MSALHRAKDEVRSAYEHFDCSETLDEAFQRISKLIRTCEDCGLRIEREIEDLAEEEEEREREAQEEREGFAKL